MSRSSSISEKRQEAGRLRRAISAIRTDMGMPARTSVYRDMTANDLGPIYERFDQAYTHWCNDPDAVKAMGPVAFSEKYGINVGDVVVFFEKKLEK